MCIRRQSVKWEKWLTSNSTKKKQGGTATRYFLNFLLSYSFIICIRYQQEMTEIELTYNAFHCRTRCFSELQQSKKGCREKWRKAQRQMVSFSQPLRRNKRKKQRIEAPKNGAQFDSTRASRLPKQDITVSTCLHMKDATFPSGSHTTVVFQLSCPVRGPSHLNPLFEEMIR